MKPVQPVRKAQKTPRSSGLRTRDFGQLALWMAATLAGVVSAVLLARGPHFRRIQRNVGTRRRRRKASLRPTRSQSLPLLAQALVGNSRKAVAEVLGLPRAAVLAGTMTLESGQCTMWRAQTWYYLVDGGDGMGMAIAFEDDFASSVEFFSAPRQQAKVNA